MLSYPCKRQSFPQFSFPPLYLSRMGKYGIFLHTKQDLCRVSYNSDTDFLSYQVELPAFQQKGKGRFSKQGGVLGGLLYCGSQLNRLSFELTLSELGHRRRNPPKRARMLACPTQKRVRSSSSSENVKFSGMLD